MLASLVKPLLLAVLYYAAARLGLQLQFETTQATPIWPASGIALAALILLGSRLAPGVFLGAFAANLADFFIKSSATAAIDSGGVLQHFLDHPTEIALSAAIGVGNMLPASVPLVCVDINPAVVTKIADRGSSQTIGLVTDVGLFLRLLGGILLGSAH